MSKKLFSECDMCTEFISTDFERTEWGKLSQYLDEVPSIYGTEYSTDVDTTLDHISVVISSNCKVNVLIVE